MKITTTSVTQPGNEILGTKDKTLYYLIVTNNKGKKLTINVGEKTHDGIKELQKEDEGVQELPLNDAKPIKNGK